MFGFGKSSATKKDAKRQETGRYGKKGTFRKERNGDKVARDTKTGKYKKKPWWK